MNIFIKKAQKNETFFLHKRLNSKKDKEDIVNKIGFFS